MGRVGLELGGRRDRGRGRRSGAGSRVLGRRSLRLGGRMFVVEFGVGALRDGLEGLRAGEILTT